MVSLQAARTQAHEVASRGSGDVQPSSRPFHSDLVRSGSNAPRASVRTIRPNASNTRSSTSSRGRKREGHAGLPTEGIGDGGGSASRSSPLPIGAPTVGALPTGVSMTGSDLCRRQRPAIEPQVVECAIVELLVRAIDAESEAACRAPRESPGPRWTTARRRRDSRARCSRRRCRRRGSTRQGAHSCDRSVQTPGRVTEEEVDGLVATVRVLDSVLIERARHR